MSEYVHIGKIVGTHALKGEIRIISDFEYKDRVFNINNELFIGQLKSKEIIETYRQHKNYDMVKFKGIDYINDVIKYVKNDVYIDKKVLNLSDDEMLPTELLGMKIYYKNNEIGEVVDYFNNNGNKVIKLKNKYLPYNKDFIEKIDKENRIITYKNIEGFL